MTTSHCPLTAAPSTRRAAGHDPIRDLARWFLAVHVLLVVAWGVLVTMVIVSSASTTIGWDSHWFWTSTGLALLGGALLGAPWTLLGDSDLLVVAPLLDLALHAALWGAIIVVRRARRARRHP